MGRFVRVLLVAALVALLLVFFLRRGGPQVQPGSVLLIDLHGSYVEAAEPPLFARLLSEPPVPFLRVYSELRKAERDPRIASVVLRVRHLGIGWAKAQELRASLARVAAAGKKTVAYLEVEPIGANKEYYVASAAQQVYMAPGTRIPFVGLAAEYLFLGGLWDKLGVEVQVARVGPYKTMADFVAGHDMTDENREMANWLLDSIDSQFVNGIAESRKLDPAAVRSAIEAAAASPEDLKARGLIDGARFLDAILDDVGGPVIEGDDYAAVDPATAGFHPQAKVALVYGSGNVVTGESGRVGNPQLASITVSKALKDAADDPSVDAILFRVDSPGGSVLASDLVWHATQSARKKKPLVVSFSDVAASGGYYVACGADAIIARPATITGSIGVLMIRPALAGLYDKLGIGHAEILRGPRSDLFLTGRALPPDAMAWLKQEVEETYQVFLDRVSQGRHLEKSAVDAVGRGRVWTGEQALERGLVDGLDGLYGSIAAVRKALDLPKDADVSLVVYPPPKPLALELRELLSGALLPTAELPLPQPFATLVAWLRDLPPDAPVLVPSAIVRIH